MHVGLKRKRTKERIDETGALRVGEWQQSQYRRVIHQASFAAECMPKSRAVFCVLSARRCETTGAVITETWGTEPWVAGELGGKTGVLEIVFRGHAARHIGAEPVHGLGDFEPVVRALRSLNLASLREAFAEANFDASAFAALGRETEKNPEFADRTLERLGVSNVGDRLKLMALARRHAETRGGEEDEL
jgi:hypothetical protein